MLRHLNILLKRKEKRLHHRGIKYLASILLPCVALILAISAYAEEQGTVEIIVDTDTNIYGTSNQLNCQILFNDMNYYNEYLYISYHLLDAENEEMIQFENERVWVSAPDDKGISNVTMDVVIDNQYKSQKLIVQLDVVDTLNQFWFSRLGKHPLSSPTLYYENNMGRMVAQKMQREIRDRPVIFMINCAVSCVSIWVYVFIKKRKVL